MKKLAIMVAALVILSFSIAGAAEKGAFDHNSVEYLKLKIEAASFNEVNKIKNDKNTRFWCELGNQMIVTCPKGKWPTFPASVRSIDPLFVEENMCDPVVAMTRGANSPLDEVKDKIYVIQKVRHFTIFQTDPKTLSDLSQKENNHFAIIKFNDNLPLLVDLKNVLREGDNGGSQNAPEVTVDEAHLLGNIKKLQDFQTRFSLTEGYVKSANFALDEFKRMGYQAKFSEYEENGKKQINVIAQKSFDASEKGFYIVCGHLDSTSEKSSTFAPGADDNASGSAGVLEIANILSKSPLAGRVRFALFAGEELGLRGSKAYVRELTASGEIKKILGVVNFDMIGFDKTAPLSSLFETKQFADPFVKNFVTAAQAEGVKVTVSYNPWGSDHVPFLGAQVPCFLFIEDEFEANVNYHKTTDTVDAINIKLSAAFVRATAKTLIKYLSQK